MGSVCWNVGMMGSWSLEKKAPVRTTRERGASETAGPGNHHSNIPTTELFLINLSRQGRRSVCNMFIWDHALAKVGTQARVVCTHARLAQGMTVLLECWNDPVLEPGKESPPSERRGNAGQVKRLVQDRVIPTFQQDSHTKVVHMGSLRSPPPTFQHSNPHDQKGTHM